MQSSAGKVLPYGLEALAPNTSPEVAAAVRPLWLTVNNLLGTVQQMQQAEARRMAVASASNPIATTAPTLASYGFTLAQGTDLIRTVNALQAAAKTK